MTRGDIEKLPDLWQHLKNINKPVALYGMGDGADKIIAECSKHGIAPCGVFASDDFVRRQNFRGFTVVSYDELRRSYPDMTVLVSFGTNRSEVLQNIKRIAAQSETYAPDVAVTGGGVFDKAYALSHFDEIFSIYGKMADALSRRTFYNVLCYKITGDMNYLFDCESKNEPIEYSDDEIFLDLGAYKGDTVQEFIRNTNGRYKRIIAAEPDRKNYAKLVKNTENLENIAALNVAVGESEGNAHFAMNAGRNSALSSEGDSVRCESVDSIMKGFDATFIKMDIEGNEAAAVAGAHQTIKQYRPKLKIAVYHRYNDILTLPQAVLKINPEYRLYMRHKPYIPAWDTDMFFL